MRRFALPVLLFLLLALSTGSRASSLTCDASTPAFSGGGNVMGRGPGQWNAYFGNKVDLTNGKACSPTIYDPTILLPTAPVDGALCVDLNGKLYVCAGGLPLNAVFQSAQLKPTGADALWTAAPDAGHLGGLLVTDHLLSSLWRVSAPEGGGALTVTRYSAGAVVDAPVSISNLTGRVTLLDGLTVTAGGLTVSAGGLAVTGALTMNGVAPMPAVATTAALKALAAGAFTAVERLGATASGDGGRGIYRWSASACSIAAGAGDDGSQVAPTVGTGCWLLETQSFYDVRQWGVTLANPIHLAVDPTVTADTSLCGIVAANKCKTITGAQITANLLDSGGNVIEIDLPASTTFTECVSQTHPLRGAVNNRPNPFNPDYTLGPTMLLVKGQGATTIWDGCPNFFYTFEASNGGVIAIQNLRMRSTGVPGQQLSFGVQFGGFAYSLGGITWDTTSNVHAFAQDPGSLLVLAGNDAIVAQGNSFANASGGASIQIIGFSLAWTAPISAGLNFTDAFFRVSNQGQILDNGPGGHNFINTIAGIPLRVSGMGLFGNQTGIALDGLVPTSTNAVSIVYGGGRVVPEPASTITAGPTGCGSTCVATIFSRGPRNGFVTITPGGTGITDNGGVNVSQGIGLVQNAGTVAPCVASLNGSLTSWNAGAAVFVGTPSLSASKYTYTVIWNNNGGVLTSGQSYVLNFVCADA